MAYVFDATASGIAANGWALDTEADDYFAGRRNASAWSALSQADKRIALVTATRTLERLTYDGSRVLSAQALKVPRAGLVDDDGLYLVTTAVPPVFKAALYEQTLHDLNKGSTDATQPTGLEAFSRVEIAGAVTLDLRAGAAPSTYASAALQLLAPFLATVPGQTRLVRA